MHYPFQKNGVWYKVCPTCGIEKVYTIESFDKNGMDKHGNIRLYPYCTDCKRGITKVYANTNRTELRRKAKEYNATDEGKLVRKVYNDQYYTSNKGDLVAYAKEYRVKVGGTEAYRRGLRNTWYKRKFGITVDEYDIKYKEQGGVCAICGCLPDENNYNKRKNFCVDHDHVTNKFRGLLCTRHNMMLGLADDLSDILRKAADYIDAHKQKDGVLIEFPKSNESANA